MHHSPAPLSLVFLFTALAGCGGSSQDTASGDVATSSDALTAQGEHGSAEPPMRGIHWARGQAGAHHGGGSSLMTLHGGNVLPSISVKAIFWGTTWGTYSGDKLTGLDSFYLGVGGSNYAGTTTEYAGENGVHVGTAVSYGGHLVDTSPAPSRAPATSVILNEVCKVIGTPPTANLYYPVYVDTPRGNANYCAWHSWGSCNGVPVEFGFFFSLDGDPGCDPQDTSGLHSQGLTALANVSGHEFSETTTDPRGASWFDSSGAENADKCEWTFGAPLVSFANGTQWKIQGNWSNVAYTARTGYLNLSGQPGCLAGR